MRRLVSSDWQLAHNERDRYRTDFVVKTLPTLISRYQPDQLLVLGDICEKKDAHPAPLVNEIVNAFCTIAKSCEIIVLQGNHDFLHNAHPFFAFLQNWKGIRWISKPEELDNCMYLPHTRNYKEDWKSLGFTKEYQYIFAHNIFTGVNAASGHALSGIPPTIFPKDAVVISGDVHEPQIVNENIIYVGSPCLCDYGDSYQPRVLLLDDLQIKSIKVYGQQKRLIKVDWDGDDSTFHHPGANEGDIVKLQVNLEMKDVPEWAAIRQEVEQWAIKRNFVVNSIVPIVVYEQGTRQKIVKSQRKSDIQYLDSFVQRVGADERVAVIGKEIVDLI